MKPEFLRTDCLIIGTGISGLCAAIGILQQGGSVVLLSCGSGEKSSNTWHAQGGIIYKAKETDKNLLKQDIFKAGCDVNYPPAVEQLADLGPRLIEEILIGLAGTEFDKQDNGEYCLTREGAHSSSRIIHKGDQTGESIESALFKWVKKHPLSQVLTQTTAINLLMSSHHPCDARLHHEKASCFGAFVFDQKKKHVFPIFARQTVLATGGVGQLFLHNTNSPFSRGDGIALASRAGCRLENLEYIQFHPTTFYHPSSRRFLISEALRGEGAILVNASSQPFLEKWLPDCHPPELASRDRLAIAIHQEMLATNASCVYLDISHKKAGWIKERFPFVYKSCLQYGVDITTQAIPVVPAAHYHCGGVWTDLIGKTSVEALWAVGETACTGVHGANRLASTSLLEGLVWGTRCGEAIGELLKKSSSSFSFPEIEPWESQQTEVDPSFLAQDWATLQSTMWNYVGMIKTETRLKRGAGILRELHSGIDSFYRKARLSDSLIGLRHASQVAILILQACQKNRQSLGCYLRGEFEI